MTYRHNHLATFPMRQSSIVSRPTANRIQTWAPMERRTSPSASLLLYSQHAGCYGRAKNWTRPPCLGTEQLNAILRPCNCHIELIVARIREELTRSARLAGGRRHAAFINANQNYGGELQSSNIVRMAKYEPSPHHSPLPDRWADGTSFLSENERLRFRSC